MKSVLHRIFLENDFEILNLNSELSSNEAFLAANYNDECVGFYLVCFLNELSDHFLSEKVPEYFHKIKSLQEGYDPRMDKNLSMIVCVNREELDITSGMIFEIEENPYFFKKYVIDYENNHLIQLNKEISEVDNICYFLNKVVNNPENFLEYKNASLGKEEFNLYEICSKLMIKLPFLKFIREKREIENLSMKIQTELTKKGLLGFQTELLTLDDQKEDFIERVILLIGGEE